MQKQTIDVGSDKPVAVADRSFAGFLKSAQGQAACGSDLIARLMPSAGNITTQHALLQWARERHPDQYPPEDWRAPPPKSVAPYGSRVVKAIWAAYLAWKEIGEVA
jgi:hypothetical protein